MRNFTLDDAAFFCALLNDPEWIRFIGDRHVHSDEQARDYLAKSYLAQYEKNGFGLYLTAQKDGTPVGMCGLIKRDCFDDVDIGFAFLPAYRGKGYAREAARAALEYGWDVLKKRRVVAIVLPENTASVALLENIGLRFERMVRLADDADELALYAIDFVPKNESMERS